MSGLLVEIDLSEIKQALEQGQRALVAGTGRAVLTAAREGVRESVSTQRYKSHSSDGLSATTQARLVTQSTSGSDAEMWWPKPYASFVDAGTKPHLIAAKRKRFLRFAGAGGNIVFRRVVHHPGTKPAGFAGVAYFKAERVLVREVESLVGRVQDIINK